jgi:hypothetical protein
MKQIEHNFWKNEPSISETLLLSISIYVIFISFVSIFDNYFAQIQVRGENPHFVMVAESLLKMDFESIQFLYIKRIFLGFPLAILLVSILPFFDFISALIVLSISCSLITHYYCHRLWGGWVACAFVTLNLDWMQRSIIGGNEPLFMALLLGGFYAYRKNRCFLAILLVSLSTLVRPFGLLALMAFGMDLLLRKEYRSFFISFLIAATFGIFYVAILNLVWGSPLAHFGPVIDQGISKLQGNLEYTMFTAPFVNLYISFIENYLLEMHIITHIKISAWFILTIIGIIAMFKNKLFYNYIQQNPAEVFFCILYLLFIFTYNSARWWWYLYPRYIIPVLPFLYFALLPYVFKDRRFIWVIGTLFAALGGASSINVYLLWERFQVFISS